MSFWSASNVDLQGAIINNAERDQVTDDQISSAQSDSYNPSSSDRSGGSSQSRVPIGPTASVLPGMSASTDQIAGLLRSLPSTFNPTASVARTLTSILHTKLLPSSKVFLDQALAHSSVDISPWETPIEWACADSGYISSIVQEIAALTESVEIEEACFIDHLIVYPRLIVYIFAHLMLCIRDRRILDEFKETLRTWKTWDNITMVQNHQQIKDYLCGLFRILRSTSAHSESILEKLLAYDVIGLAAHLTSLVIDGDQYKKLIARRSTGAQHLVDLLQARLDFSNDDAFGRCHVKALIELSKASALYPQCLVLEGVEKVGRPFARGDMSGFGSLYKGQFQAHEVAIKVLRIKQYSTDMDTRLKEFLLCEAVTWRQLRHPNILPFYGVYCGPTVSLVSPWLKNGNIVEFLAERAPESNCVFLSLDIAQGLEYLHREGIVHGDMKGPNILISRSHRACLGDFGLVSARDANPAWMPTIRRSVRWQAPELFLDAVNLQRPRRNTLATDVYAFAMVCYEMFSGRIPFFDIPRDELSIRSSVKDGKRPDHPSRILSPTPNLTHGIHSVTQEQRPDFPSHDLSRRRGLSDEVWDLVEACWAQDPTQRPTAEQMVERLRALPNQPVDHRPPDDFSMNLPLQTLYNYIENPFSALATVDQMSFPSRPSKMSRTAQDDTYLFIPEEPPEPLSFSIELTQLEDLVDPIPEHNPISFSIHLTPLEDLVHSIPKHDPEPQSLFLDIHPFDNDFPSTPEVAESSTIEPHDDMCLNV